MYLTKMLIFPVQNREWASGESEHFVAEVQYGFDAGSDKELNIMPGQTIRLAPAKLQPQNLRGWALASDGSRIGLVPLNYIKVLGKRSCTGITTLNKGFGKTDEKSYPEPHSRPRVRFDLNPRPASSTYETDSANCKAEPTGILVRNDNMHTSAEETDA